MLRDQEGVAASGRGEAANPQTFPLTGKDPMNMTPRPSTINYRRVWSGPVARKIRSLSSRRRSMSGSFRTRVRSALTAALMVAGSLVALGLPTAAHADLQNPRQDFLRGSVGGLFLHWGERTSPQHTDCAQWERDVLGGGWTAQYWVNEAKKLHVQYLVLATF